MSLWTIAQLAAVWAASSALIYTLLLLSYRITLHPLAKYPGPLLARLTDSYGAFFAASRSLHLVTFENHVKYGPVVRQGPGRLVFNTAQALHDIYQNPRLTKSPLYRLAQMSSQSNIFDTTDVETHKRKRKIISRPLTEKAMRDFLPTISEQVDVFIRELRASTSKPVNMTQRCMWLGGDIVGQLAFGYSLQQQTRKTNRWLQPGLALASARINVYMQAPWVRKLEPLLKVFVKKSRDKYVNILNAMITNRLAMDKDAKHDLYSYAVDEMGGRDAASLADSELWAEAFFFIVAGGNTIAATICALFFYLSRNSSCYRKLAEEVRGKFQDEQDITPGELSKRCGYLHACVNETLRCATPNTGTLWRQQLSVADDTCGDPLIIDGHEIPPGIDLGVNLYAIHHNPEYFPDPFIFRPERWLDSSDAQLRAMKSAFAPFILGARSCPGKAVANIEIGLTVARTLWNFDFEVAPGDEGKVGAGEPGRHDRRHRETEYQLFDTFSAMHDGPVLRFCERK
ncbi:hypothetical protein HIM_05600 [Hirsutella minnesotensis 3608]|uniref:Uncharacterized protein n=1 Tax=Hirsutella minnesotensis 3608 TaxID=1043627 RepID=A0A0F8A5D0_9HYPO|nr:hypothetical protein HIM_05600 [Hirsutella minnesotensis 3608]